MTSTEVGFVSALHGWSSPLSPASGSACPCGGLVSSATDKGSCAVTDGATGSAGVSTDSKAELLAAAELVLPVVSPPLLVTAPTSVAVCTVRLRRSAQRPPVSICEPKGPNELPPKCNSFSLGHIPAASAPTRRCIPASASILDDKSRVVRLEPVPRKPSHKASRSESVMPAFESQSSSGLSVQRAMISDADNEGVVRPLLPADVDKSLWEVLESACLEAAATPNLSPTT
mmetsp:Transcript_13877/g.28999  ORF Transcript_13877/g.28999 Transcript_13877/m.28999 type:complete len:230 (-) Transcript_13877:336-1025(-)